MAPDKYSATWVSHTSISDFLVSPRLYYLKNVYRDPKTGNKIQIMKPPLALGQAVHEVLENLSRIPAPKRFSRSLIEEFETVWQKVSGQRGGFFDADTEYRYKSRGQEMLRRVMQHPGPLAKAAVKISMDLPQFWLSEDEAIMLCGKIDWLEYLADSDSVHIIDFKTGKSRPNDFSMQLAIYCLLVHECQKRNVQKVSFWFLEDDDRPIEQPLPDLQVARSQILDIARKIKLARSLEKYDDPQASSIREVQEYESVLTGEAQYVATGEYRQDIYVLKQSAEDTKESFIL